MDNEKSMIMQAFCACMDRLSQDDFPVVELRPRLRNANTALTGDYDFLMDELRFEEVVRLFFDVCRPLGVSFHVRQRELFKRQIILFDQVGNEILFEFWPHAELTVTASRRRPVYFDWASYESARAAGLEQEVLTLLFICHLHFKGKDLRHLQVIWRFNEFSRRLSGDHAGHSMRNRVRDLLQSLSAGNISLFSAGQQAVDLLEEMGVAPCSVFSAMVRRGARRLVRIGQGWGGRVVPCAGPDGSGKTTFLQELSKLTAGNRRVQFIRFKKLFRGSRIYSHFNKKYRNRLRLERNTADERLAPWVWLIAFPKYLGLALLSLERKAVFMDRFFIEFLVRGYRETSTSEIRAVQGYSLLLGAVPEPRKLVLMMADFSVLNERGGDMSPDAVEDFYCRYMHFMIRRRVMNVLFLNVRQPSEMLANSCLRMLRLSVKPSFVN